MFYEAFCPSSAERNCQNAGSSLTDPRLAAMQRSCAELSSVGAEGLRRSVALPCDGGPSSGVLVSFLFFFFVAFCVSWSERNSSVSLSSSVPVFFSVFVLTVKKCAAAAFGLSRRQTNAIPQKYCVTCFPVFSCLLQVPSPNLSLLSEYLCLVLCRHC